MQFYLKTTLKLTFDNFAIFREYCLESIFKNFEKLYLIKRGIIIEFRPMYRRNDTILQHSCVYIPRGILFSGFSKCYLSFKFMFTFARNV